MKTNKYIVFDAEPFCFGPISTTLNIVRELKKLLLKENNIRFILLGKLTTVQLSKTTNLFDEVIDCNTTDFFDFKKHKDLLKNALMFVCNTNIKGIQFYHDLNIDVPSIFVDTLFWMWDKIEIDYKKLTAYYIQDFIGINEQMKRLNLSPEYFKITGPIIVTDQIPTQEKKNEILINFGGIENIYNKSGYYIEQLSDLILDVLSRNNLYSEYKITICGGGDEIKKLKEHINDENICIGTLSPEDFINKLRVCKHFLSLPGLTSFYESIYFQSHTFFLLPQNYSQYLQLEKYKNFFKNISGLNWNNFEGMENINDYEDELISVEKIQKCNKLFFRNDYFKKVFKQSLSCYFNKLDKKENFHVQIIASESNYQKLYNDKNSFAAKKIARDIYNLIR